LFKLFVRKKVIQYSPKPWILVNIRRGKYLTIIPRTRVVHELIAYEARSAE
jgi:hypothetical protein